jgi:hypothetical protein
VVAEPPPTDNKLNLFEELRDNGPLWLRDAGDWLRRREGFEMLTAILGGGRMGAGGGWFHPAQSRYDWHWLAKRYDRDRDGKISRAEFGGPDEVFRRLDRDGDGFITTQDLDWSERSAFLRESAQVKQLFAQLDRNSNGRISRAEWDSLFEKMAGDKGYLTPDDLRPLVNLSAQGKKGPAAKAKAAGGGMPATSTLLLGLVTGELGSLCEGPQIGDVAPAFRLATHDGKQQISLGQFRGKKPVVLIFGSFT